MKYKAIIFDFDGVLFNSEHLHLMAFNQVLDSLNVHLSEEEYFNCYTGHSDDEIFKLINKKRGLALSLTKIERLKLAKIHVYTTVINNSPTLEAVPDVKDFIVSWSKRISHFAICSNSSRSEIDATLCKLDQGQLHRYFNNIVSIEDVKEGKPSPEGYLLAIKRFNLRPSECLIIEDSPSGILAARAAGIDVVAITTTHVCDRLKKAMLAVDNYPQLTDWLLCSAP